jgi:hypothetical protein
VLKIRAAIAQTLQVPAGIAIWPEEQHAHVVVDTVDTPPKLVKVSYAFRANQTRRTRDQDRFHPHSPMNHGKTDITLDDYAIGQYP